MSGFLILTSVDVGGLMSISFGQMPRVAIIIGAPGSPYLHGVKQDCENWYKHLISPQGGTWRNTEIVTLWQPSLSEVQSTIKGAVAEYCIVIFSGHGAEYNTATSSPYTSHHIFLNSSVHCPVECLCNASTRQLIITDSCRTSIEGVGLGDYFLPEQNLRYFNRNTSGVFMKHVRQQPPGKILIQSCAKGQTAREDGIGGHFTQSLFRWMWEVDNSSSYHIADTYSTIYNAYAIMRNTYSANNQQPTICTNNEGANYPLGLRFASL